MLYRASPISDRNDLRPRPRDRAYAKVESEEDSRKTGIAPDQANLLSALISGRDVEDGSGRHSRADRLLYREDALVIARACAHGCVVVGKTNLHEWAFGVTNVNPHYGPVRNPHDAARVPGGSSVAWALEQAWVH